MRLDFTNYDRSCKQNEEGIVEKTYFRKLPYSIGGS